MQMRLGRGVKEILHFKLQFPHTYDFSIHVPRAKRRELFVQL